MALAPIPSTSYWDRLYEREKCYTLPQACCEHFDAAAMKAICFHDADRDLYAKTAEMCVAGPYSLISLQKLARSAKHALGECTAGPDGLSV